MLNMCQAWFTPGLQNGLGNEWTCEMTLASAYVLYHLPAAWLQLQMMERSLRWE